MNRFNRSSIFASQILRPMRARSSICFQLPSISWLKEAPIASSTFTSLEIKQLWRKSVPGSVKFPDLEVNYSDGKILKLPVSSNGNGNVAEANKLEVPKASLVCLSFRASSQGMINSLSAPFLDAFSGSKDVRLYESPIKKLLLRIMRKSKHHESTELKRQIVYSFGDHYYSRKELKILNLLTGYIFLLDKFGFPLDKFGRIRCQGTGLATEEESSSLFSCTKLLLEEK